MNLLEIMFSGFWQFIGCWILLGSAFYGTLRFLFLVINRSLRAGNIRKQGWPPLHLDADGDSIELQKKAKK
jgi:hypothetical protein